MKKIFSFLVIFSSLLLPFEVDAQDQTLPPIKGSWKVINVDFPENFTNKMKIAATFEYTSSLNEAITFKNNYIHHISCSVTQSNGDKTTTLLDRRRKFPIIDSKKTFSNGDTVTSTFSFNINKKAMSALRGKKTLWCALGFAVPTEYRAYSFWYGKDVTMSYILRRNKNKWDVTPWDF